MEVWLRIDLTPSKMHIGHAPNIRFLRSKRNTFVITTYLSVFYTILLFEIQQRQYNFG